MLVESTAYKQDTGDTIYPASGPQGGNPTCCLSGCIDDVITGVSKLGLRMRWIAVTTGVAGCDCDCERDLGTTAPPVLL